ASPSRRDQGAGPHHRRRRGRQPAAYPPGWPRGPHSARHLAGARYLLLPRPLYPRRGDVADVQYGTRNDRRGRRGQCRDRPAPARWGDLRGRRHRGVRAATCPDPRVSRLRVGVLVSGQGSNLQALIQAGRDPMYPARVVVVLANRDCPALDYARKAGITRAVFDARAYPDRKARDLEMVKTLRFHDVDLVVCAGYDAIL